MDANSKTQKAESMAELAARLRMQFPDIVPESKTYPLLAAPETAITSGAVTLPVEPSLSPFAIESLVEEINVLLQRCLASRELKLDLEAKALELWLTTAEAADAEAIRRKQIALGEFRMPADIATLEEAMQRQAAQNASRAEASRKNALAMRQTGNPIYKKRAELSGQLAAAIASRNFADARKDAQQQTETMMEVERASTEADAEMATVSRAQHETQSEIASKKKKFEVDNVALRLALFENEVTYRGKRIALARQPNVGLNYAQRMSENQALFEADFASAYWRIRALRRGLVTLYGIDHPLPVLANTSLTAFILWHRAALDSLALIGDRQVTFGTTISIKALSGDQSWKDLVKSGVLAFLVPQSLLPDFLAVRLKGLRAYSNNQAAGTWAIQITLPEKAEFTLPSGQKTTLAQSEVPQLFLGNVSARSDSRNDATVTSRAMLNVSPFGTWTVAVGEKSVEGKTRASLDDLFLELELVGLHKGTPQ